jgi:hypothetical protein
MLVRVFVLIPQLRRRFTGNTASTVVDGAEMRFQFHVRRRSKTKNVTSVQLGLDLPDQFRFRIQRETAFDRFAKAIGIAHEWQTHDPRFDAEAYILSDDAVLLAALSGSESLREAVAGLLDQSFKVVIRCGGGTFWVETDYTGSTVRASDETLARELAAWVLTPLMRVREELKQVSSGMWQAARDQGLRRQNVLLILTLVLAAVGIAAFFFPVGLGMPRQLVETAIATRATWISGSVLAALLVFASLLMGARSRLHWVLLELVFMGGPAIWLIGNAVSQWQNQQFDVSPPQTREVRIDRKHVEHSRRSTHY